MGGTRAVAAATEYDSSSSRTDDLDSETSESEADSVDDLLDRLSAP